MKKTYQEPGLRSLDFRFEGLICISPGTAGGEGLPGAPFDPDNGDIFDGGTF
jgi:hypothetical protein